MAAIPCDPGYYLGFNETCTACPPGTYTSYYNREHACKFCPPFYATNKNASVICDPCEVGTTSNGTHCIEIKQQSIPDSFFSTVVMVWILIMFLFLLCMYNSTTRSAYKKLKYRAEKATKHLITGMKLHDTDDHVMKAVDDLQSEKDYSSDASTEIVDYEEEEEENQKKTTKQVAFKKKSEQPFQSLPLFDEDLKQAPKTPRDISQNFHQVLGKDLDTGGELETYDEDGDDEDEPETETAIIEEEEEENDDDK